MRIYISGPITGRKQREYMNHFTKAQIALEEKGYAVVNPATINANMPKDTTYAQYMLVSFAELTTCDEIYMLTGWENSRGAKQELAYAVTRHMPVLFEEVEK